MVITIKIVHMKKSQELGMVVRTGLRKVLQKDIGNGYKSNLKNNKKMNVAILSSPKYENVRKLREFLFNIKEKMGTDVNIITRGNKDGGEKYIRKYAIEFGFRYTEYNPAHTVRNLYSGMSDEYYSKPFHPTQTLHQYDCVVKHADKFFYFGGIKPSEQKHFEKLLVRFGKKVNYIN
jgi:hypothetical protein